MRSREVILHAGPSWMWSGRRRGSTSWRCSIPAAPLSQGLASCHYARLWAIVTSASERVARHRLNCAGLPLPHVLVGAEAVINGKPDPEPYLLGLNGLASRPIVAWCSRMPAGIESACVQVAPWCR